MRKVVSATNNTELVELNADVGAVTLIRNHRDAPIFSPSANVQHITSEEVRITSTGVYFYKYKIFFVNEQNGKHGDGLQEKGLCKEIEEKAISKIEHACEFTFVYCTVCCVFGNFAYMAVDM